jgi:hypothetical protein
LAKLYEDMGRLTTCVTDDCSVPTASSAELDSLLVRIATVMTKMFRQAIKTISSLINKLTLAIFSLAL